MLSQFDLDVIAFAQQQGIPSAEVYQCVDDLLLNPQYQHPEYKDKEKRFQAVKALMTDSVYAKKIGTPVRKISGKPFKNGEKVVTIHRVTINHDSPKRRVGYRFVECAGVVSAEVCEDNDETPKEFLMVAETSYGHTLKQEWVPATSLAEARKKFFDSLTSEQQDECASTEDIDIRILPKTITISEEDPLTNAELGAIIREELKGILRK